MRHRALFVTITVLLLVPASASAAGPEPGTPEYLQRDNQNIVDAYGRQTGQQLGNPAYTQALTAEHNEVWVQQLAQQAATPNRLAITPGNVFPGWNGGNPLRRGWTGRRGMRVPVSYTNRYGALIRGNVFAPLPGRARPVHGQAAAASISGRGDHHRVDPGLGAHVLVAGPGPGGARLRRPHL